MWKDLAERFSIDIDMGKTTNLRFKDSKKPFEHYSHAYRNNEQELVDQLCENEIKHFGYKFDDQMASAPSKYVGYYNL